MIKFFSAILVAGITLTLISFIGNKAIIAQELEKDAVPIEVIAKVKTEPKQVKTTNNEEVAIETAEEAPASLEELIASADLKKGAKLSKKCAACHSFNEGGKHKIGPNLWNIVGSKAATKDGFKYSKALISFDGEWNHASLNEFILKPKKFISGTKMGYAGMKKIEDRAALIAWMQTQSE